jgi:hypothetical protein
VAAVIRNAEVKLNKMEYGIGKFDELKEDDRRWSTIHLVTLDTDPIAAKFGSVAAVLALYASTCTLQYKTTDDLLAIAPKKNSGKHIWFLNPLSTPNQL